VESWIPLLNLIDFSVKISQTKYLNKGKKISQELEKVYMQMTINMFQFIAFKILSFPYWWLINKLLTTNTWQVPPVEKEFLAFPEHLSSPPVLSGVHFVQYLIFCIVFYRSLFVFLSFFTLAIALSLLLSLRLLITSLISSNLSYSTNIIDSLP